MRRSHIVTAVLAALAIPAVASAIPARPGPYVSGFAGVSAVRDTDATTTDFSFSPPQSFNDRVRFDPSINVGGTGGYDFGYIRLEGEISYKRGEISGVTSQGGGTTADIVSTDGSLGAVGFMGNMFIDIDNPSPVTPYFGGGIGFAALHLSDTTGINRSNGNFGGVFLRDDDTVFAWQAGAGLEIALNRMLSLDVGYRYFATSKATFDSTIISTGMKFESHNGAVGIRVKFY